MVSFISANNKLLDMGALGPMCANCAKSLPPLRIHDIPDEALQVICSHCRELVQHLQRTVDPDPLPEDPLLKQQAYSALETNARLLKSGQYSDLTVKCGEDEYKVHRAIVSPRSKVFAAMINGGFKEAATGVIDLCSDDHDPNTIKRVIDFMYTGNYHDGNTGGEDGKRLLVNNTLVYVSAEFFNIPALKELASTKYQRALKQEGATESFFTSVRLLYDGTPDSDDELKVIAAKWAAFRIVTLGGNEGFLDLCSDFRNFHKRVFSLLKPALEEENHSPQSHLNGNRMRNYLAAMKRVQYSARRL